MVWSFSSRGSVRNLNVHLLPDVESPPSFLSNFPLPAPAKHYAHAVTRISRGRLYYIVDDHQKVVRELDTDLSLLYIQYPNLATGDLTASLTFPSRNASQQEEPRNTFIRYLQGFKNSHTNLHVSLELWIKTVERLGERPRKERKVATYVIQ